MKQHHNKNTSTKDAPETIASDADNQNALRPLTPEEQALAARVSIPDDSWRTISEEGLQDYSLAEDPYPLPKEAQDRQMAGELAFRWSKMDPQTLDERRTAPWPWRWLIANRDQTPFLARYCDPVHGAVQCKDQILMFKPWSMHRAAQRAKMDVVEAKDRSGDLSQREGMSRSLDISNKSVEAAHFTTGSRAQVGRGDVIVDEVENIGEMSVVEM